MKKFYLASPFFTDKQRDTVCKVANILRAAGHEVFVPMEHKIEDAWSYSPKEWAEKVFSMDVDAIRTCDEVIALYYGLNSDTGTAFEIGYAYASSIPVHVIPMTNPNPHEKFNISVMIASAAAESSYFDEEQMNFI